jgi:hypothetical protein
MMEHLETTPLSVSMSSCPRIWLAQLNLYESLAKHHDELAKKSTDPDSRPSRLARIHAKTYHDLLGFDPSERDEVRRSLEHLIAGA